MPILQFRGATVRKARRVVLGVAAAPVVVNAKQCILSGVSHRRQLPIACFVVCPNLRNRVATSR